MNHTTISSKLYVLAPELGGYKTQEANNPLPFTFCFATCLRYMAFSLFTSFDFLENPFDLLKG
ncbi:hypothetical protein IX95_05585 [Vibrio sp. B183]|nr:hypothetical protein IX95_05585 [Vibrio sp. B183]